MIDGIVTVYIANQHDLIREGLAALMERHGFVLAGTAATLSESCQGVAATRPHVLLLDATLLGNSGRQLLCRLRQVSPSTRAIVLTESLTPEGLAESVAGGAYGYLALANTQQIISATRMAASAAMPFDLPTLRAALTSTNDLLLQTPEWNDSAADDFTQAEQRILALLANGHGNRAMAERLHVSINTIKTHMRHIFEKLGVSDRTSAALWASQQSWG